MTQAHVEVRPDDARVDILISGEVDLSNSESVQNEVFTAISNDLLAVHLDLGGLTYIDSAGIRLLFALAERLRLLQTECTVIAPIGSPTRRVIELAGLDSLVDVRD